MCDRWVENLLLYSPSCTSKVEIPFESESIKKKNPQMTLLFCVKWGNHRGSILMSGPDEEDTGRGRRCCHIHLTKGYLLELF